MMPYYVGIDGGGTKTPPWSCAPAVPQPTAALCLAP